MLKRQSFRLGVIVPESIDIRRTSKEKRSWWKKNYADNLERFKREKPKGIKGNFEERFFNVPGFLVAAGPSLDKNMGELKKINGKCPIFAVDAALPVLVKNGIRPDYVITVEGDEEAIWFWEDIDTSDYTLICTTVASPKVIDSWKGDIYFYNAWTDDDGTFDLGKLWSGGNVSTTMFSFAVGICAINPTIFVGHDFSFPEPKPEFYFPKDGTRLRDLCYEDIKKTSFETVDIYGNKVYTIGQLFFSRNWTEQWILKIYHLECRWTIFVNATEGGILGVNLRSPKPLEQITLKEAIRKYCGLYTGEM